MTHQSRLVLLPNWHETIVDLNDIVTATKMYYPGNNKIQIFLRSNPAEPLIISEQFMEEAWTVLKQHLTTLEPL